MVKVIGKFRLLNLFSDFIILPILSQNDIFEDLNNLLSEIDVSEVPIKIDVNFSVRESKLIDARKFGKKPLIAVVGSNGKGIAVIDDDYRIWLHNDVFNELSEAELGEIDKAFWEEMTNEEFVRELVEAKASLYGVSLTRKDIEKLTNAIVKEFSKTKEAVFESVDKLIDASEKLDKFIRGEFDTVVNVTTEEDEEEENDLDSGEEDKPEEEQVLEEEQNDDVVGIEDEDDIIDFDKLIEGVF